MNAKDKAKELVNKFYYLTADYDLVCAKQCTLIGCEFAEDMMNKQPMLHSNTMKFIEEVKIEIEKL